MRTRPISLSRFRAEILGLYADLGRRPLTVCRLRQVLSELENLRGENGDLLISNTADLTTRTMARWDALHRHQRAPATRAALLSYARAACSYAVEEDWLRQPPNWRRLWPREKSPPKTRHLPWVDVVRLLDILREAVPVSTDPGRFPTEHRIYALVATVSYTGLRRDEALCLRISDVNLFERQIRLVSHDKRPLKTAASRRLVPIPPELHEILEAWMPLCGSAWLFPGTKRATPWRGGRLGHRPIDALRSAADSAGVSCPGWHALRHSWITHARTRWGLPDAVVTAIAGHTQLSTTDLYTHADGANLAAATSRVSYRS